MTVIEMVSCGREVESSESHRHTQLEEEEDSRHQAEYHLLAREEEEELNLLNTNGVMALSAAPAT